jgi:hypothetical protein
MAEFMPDRSSGLFGARKHRRLQQCGELISFDLAIAKNCREQSWTNRLAGMDGYDGAVGQSCDVASPSVNRKSTRTF